MSPTTRWQLVLCMLCLVPAMALAADDETLRDRAFQEHVRDFARQSQQRVAAWHRRIARPDTLRMALLCPPAQKNGPGLKVDEDVTGTLIVEAAPGQVWQLPFTTNGRSDPTCFIDAMERARGSTGPAYWSRERPLAWETEGKTRGLVLRTGGRVPFDSHYRVLAVRDGRLVLVHQSADRDTGRLMIKDWDKTKAKYQELPGTSMVTWSKSPTGERVMLFPDQEPSLAARIWAARCGERLDIARKALAETLPALASKTPSHGGGVASFGWERTVDNVTVIELSAFFLIDSADAVPRDRGAWETKDAKSIGARPGAMTFRRTYVHASAELQAVDIPGGQRDRALTVLKMALDECSEMEGPAQKEAQTAKPPSVGIEALTTVGSISPDASRVILSREAIDELRHCYERRWLKDLAFAAPVTLELKLDTGSFVAIHAGDAVVEDCLKERLFNLNLPHQGNAIVRFAIKPI